MNAPIRILAVVGAVAVVMAAACSVYAARAVRAGFSSRDAPSRIEALLARGARRLAMPERLRDLRSPLPAGPDVIGAGRAHFADHCAGCHGNDGRGGTPMGRNLYPRAPDMTAPATQDLTDGELYTIIQNGIRLTGMPAWGEPGEHDHESWALVAFIRHLPQVTNQEIREMEDQNPRSRAEWRQEMEDERFLQGESDLERAP